METMPLATDAGRVHTVASSTLPSVRERDHITGSNSPRLTLVEYGDFGCPYCFAAPAETQAGLRERNFREPVLADIEGGRRAEVHATPTFFVDGERLARPWRELAQIVPAKLAATYSEGGAS